MIKQLQRPIKLFIVSVTTLFISNAYADFELAMDYYTKGEFKPAFEEFLEAASFGDHQAQFNLGAMYLRGEHVTKDSRQAYAWLSLAAQDAESNATDIAKRIYTRLSEADQTKANSILINLKEQYSDNVIEEKLTPEFIGTNPQAIAFRNKLKIIPEYPKSMLKLRKDGFVDIFFSIGKDGITRDHVVYHSPSKAFETAAINALRQWQYEPLIINGQPQIVSGVKNRFKFLMKGNNYSTKKLKAMSQKMHLAAQEGDARAKLAYAYFIEAIPTYSSDFTPEDNPNDWYTKAAKAGSSTASYFLGRNILYGDMCTSNNHQSMGWLLKAAHQNLSNAQYTLALEAFSGAHFEKDHRKGFYWLRKAAQHNQAAQLQLAWILSTHPDAQLRNLTEAETNLAKVEEKNCIDKQTFYQTHAAVAAEKGDFSKALKWAGKALKDAKQLKLPLTRIESHIASYKAKKPWREAI